MKLSAWARKTLIDEIEFTIEKMRENKDPKLIYYYFSAVYGVLHRIFNIEYSSDLVFVHFVLSSIHSQINSRLQTPDKVIEIPDELFDKLITATNELLDDIKNNRNPYKTLKKFTLLGYVTIGNGYYLYQKGLIKL